MAGRGEIHLCFIFCFVSFIVLLVRYFTTLTPMGLVPLFGIAYFAYFVLFFSFGIVCLFASFVAVYFVCFSSLLQFYVHLAYVTNFN